MKTEIVSAALHRSLLHAVDVLTHGGVVAFPTDTVYGLAALPTNDENIERLYVVKGRTQAKAIAMLLAGAQDLPKVAVNPTPMSLKLAEKYWPGPLTLIISRHPDIPKAISSDDTIGVRVPDHPVALALLRLSGPLAVTSANLSGKPNCLSAPEVLAQLQGRIHLLLDGGITPGGVPSTVVDCTGAQPVVLREGPISLEDIRRTVG